MQALEKICRNKEMMTALKVQSKAAEPHTKYFSSLFLSFLLHLPIPNQSLLVLILFSSFDNAFGFFSFSSFHMSVFRLHYS
jgi:hypothetical protein